MGTSRIKERQDEIEWLAESVKTMIIENMTKPKNIKKRRWKDGHTEIDYLFDMLLFNIDAVEDIINNGGRVDEMWKEIGDCAAYLGMIAERHEMHRNGYQHLGIGEDMANLADDA